MKKIKRIWEQKKEVIILIAMVMLLFVNLVRATVQVSELKMENNELKAEINELWLQVDRYTPTCEEND